MASDKSDERPIVEWRFDEEAWLTFITGAYYEKPAKKLGAWSQRKKTLVKNGKRFDKSTWRERAKRRRATKEVRKAQRRRNAAARRERARALKRQYAEAAAKIIARGAMAKVCMTLDPGRAYSRVELLDTLRPVLPFPERVLRTEVVRAWGVLKLTGVGKDVIVLSLYGRKKRYDALFARWVADGRPDGKKPAREAG
jgi:hypothetical protein